MKITLKKLQQIITEEVIKEELTPEIAAPAIAAMLQGTEATTTSDIFGAVFDHMYGEGALEDAAERMAAAPDAESEEDYPTEYQAGGAYGDRPRVGFEEGLEEIIKQELKSVLNESCPPDPLQQLADQLGIDIAELADTIERMGLEVSQIHSPDMPEDPYGEEPEMPMMESHQFDPTQEISAQGLSHDDTLYYEPEEDLENMSDQELMDMAYQDGVEDFIVLDGEGDLVNREEIIKVLNDIGERLSENLPPGKDVKDFRRQVGGIRRQVGDMSYEIEKMLVALLKAGYSPEDIVNMAIQIKQMDLHPEDVQVAESKKKDNPWAICTASVGREDKEKYEKRVKSVKKEKGIK